MNKTLLKGGFFAHGVLNQTPKESFEHCKKGAVIVDVRESYLNSFKMFNVGNVIYLPSSELTGSYSDLPSDKMLIFADSVGLRSRECVLFMNEHGYDNVFNMAGGIVDWERDGLPVTTDINSRLSGSCMCQLKPREGVRRQATGDRRQVTGKKTKITIVKKYNERNYEELNWIYRRRKGYKNPSAGF